MEIQTPKVSVPAGNQSSPIKRLTTVDPAIKEKAQEFQAVLLNQLIAAMEPKDGFFGKGFGGGFFQSLFRDEMSKQLAKQLDLGLESQLTKAKIQAEAMVENKK